MAKFDAHIPNTARRYHFLLRLPYAGHSVSLWPCIYQFHITGCIITSGYCISHTVKWMPATMGKTTRTGCLSNIEYGQGEQADLQSPIPRERLPRLHYPPMGLITSSGGSVHNISTFLAQTLKSYNSLFNLSGSFSFSHCLRMICIFR